MRIVIVAAAVVLLVLALLWVFQRQLIYLPEAAAPDSVGAKDVVLRTDDGLDLGAWLVPARKPDRGIAVLVANGNAGNRAGRAPLAQALAAEGLTVLLFDYRGYGGNEGNPSERGLARDVRAAQRYLVEEAGFPPRRVVYFGESLGAAVVTELATAIAPGGLVLRSPFVDLASVGRVHYPFLPVGLLLRDDYPVTEQLVKVNAPVAVIYGSGDSIVPPAQSRAVAQAAPTLKELVEIPGYSARSLRVSSRRVDRAERRSTASGVRTPDTLLGHRLYTDPNVPAIAASAQALLTARVDDEGLAPDAVDPMLAQVRRGAD